MFGQPGNPSFGFNATAQNSPFGQSAFGKTIATTSFGTNAPAVFGSNTSLFSSKPAGTTGGGLFGNTTSTPTFGASTVTQSSFGGFGNANTTAPLFGTQQNTNTNLFGTTNTASAFGQANKPNTFGFGQTTGTSLFGQPQQQATQQTTAFGQTPNTGNTGLFGTTTGFGATNTVNGISGTVVKFNPVTGTDTMVKNGVTQTISTRHHCITCMKEYESKSLEELRLEDYTAGRKGVAQGQTSAMFGSAQQASPFGVVASNNTTANTGFGAITGGFGSTSQPATNNLFSKPITGFGAPATTSSAFAFNSTTSSNLFNNQSKPFGATTTPLFAAGNTTATPGSTFGNLGTQNTGFGTGFNSGQNNQSIGLFSQNKPAFNLPSSTTTTTFGFGQPSTTNSNLFGSKPIGTGFGTNFGTTATSTFPTGTPGFGNAQNTNTSLFNNTFKPAGPTSGFTFGNTSTAGTTGLGTAGTSLFNSSTKPSLFGTTNPTTFNTAGTFGSIPTFGTNTNNLSSVGSNLFGSGINMNNVQPSTGSVPVHQQILALVSAPFGDSPLLKNLLPASGKSEQFLKPSNSMTKSLNNSHYKVITGNNTTKLKPKVVAAVPLAKKSLFDGLEEEDPLLEAFQPRPNAKRLVLRPKSNSLLDLSDKNLRNEKCNTSLGEPVSPVTDKENEAQETNRLPNDRRSSNSWLKSSFPRKSKIIDDQYSDQPHVFSECELSSTAEGLENTVAELISPSENQPNLSSDSCAKEISELNTQADKSNIDCSLYESKSSSELDDTSNIIQLDEVPNKANVKLQRYGYYTIPSLDTLDNYVKDKTCIVPHFTVGREGYGNVYFADSFDIYGLNLDEIVHFRHKEVIIYPDDSVKPPVGQGLNRKAQVTLDRVWPHDKSRHEPITDPKRLIEMDYEGKLRRVSAKHDTRFLEYRPETGSWVFKVDHFSKYGLSDSDDDETENSANLDIKKLKAIRNQKPDENLKNQQPSEDMELVESHLPSLDKKRLSAYKFKLQQPETDNTYEPQTLFSPSTMNARLVGTESHTLQLMKATFFEYNENNLIHEAIQETKQRLVQKNNKALKIDDIINKSTENFIERSLLESSIWPRDNQVDNQLHATAANKKQLLMETEPIKSVIKDSQSKKALPPPIIRPRVAVLKYKCRVAPLSHSLIKKDRFKYIADMSIQMGKTFRPSWGPELTLISLSTQHRAENMRLVNTVDQLGSYIDGSYFDDFISTHIVQRLQILGGSNVENAYVQTFKESIEGHLNIQLDYSNVKVEEHCPLVVPLTGEASVNALHAHKTHSLQNAYNLDADSLIYFRDCDVWRLCESLWGKISDSLPTDNNSHETVMCRKEAVSDWLKLVTSETVEQEIATMESNDEIILSLLSANQLEEACNRTLKAGDHCLALLLSQVGGTLATRELIKQQIGLWQDTEVDKNFSVHRLKLFMLIAGIPVITSNNATVNICEQLDWKRALAIHLWYLALPTASITDVLDLYEASFSGPSSNIYAAAPHPEYFKNDFKPELSNDKSMYDLCYHLLKLYCTGNHPLEAILNPQNYTHDPLDYRLKWLLQQTLTSLGYTHLSDYVAALMHANFAAQLETFDLWHWAIFVVLHFKDASRRRKAVNDLLLRHVELDKTADYVKREKFLSGELKIPIKWINYAKAIKASAMKRYGEAAWYYIHSEEWNKAHEIIMDHLATDAIINEDHEYLRALLTLLTPNNCYNTISGWTYQGQLLWDYLVVTTEIESLLEQENCEDVGYKLELLQPQLVSLCSKINHFPCPTIKHRLCQAEMAKRTLQLARGLLMLQSKDEQASDFLVHLISQLPLPEDYAQQELRPIINMCVNDIILS